MMENPQPGENNCADQLETDTANRSERSVSDPKPISDKKPVKINYMPGGTSASFISQRSSSFESAESPQDSDEEQADLQTPVSGTAENNDSDFRGSGEPARSKSSERSKTITSSDGRSEEADENHQWSFTGDASPASMLHPAHQSTPVHSYRTLSTVTEEGSSMALSTDRGLGDQTDLGDKEIFMPGDLHTPILGFETMEARSRFTVFKIQVQKKEDDTCWFVFRRYSDFVHLNERLKFMYPGFRFALPPKRWFRDNFNKEFLEERLLGLQAFLDNLTGHKDICNSAPVRDFLCVDEPPGPHDSIEESRALCDQLEESVYTLKEELREKDAELALMKEELELYKSQVELLSARLRDCTGNSGAKGESVVSPISTRHSLAECDRHSPLSPDSASDLHTELPCTEAANNKDAVSEDGSQGSSNEKFS